MDRESTKYRYHDTHQGSDSSCTIAEMKTGCRVDNGNLCAKTQYKSAESQFPNRQSSVHVEYVLYAIPSLEMPNETNQHTRRDPD